MASHSKTVAKSGSGKEAKPVSSARSQTPSAAPKKAAPIKVDKTATVRASAAKPTVAKATPVAKPAPAAKPAKSVAAKPAKVTAKKTVVAKPAPAPAKKAAAKPAAASEKTAKAKTSAPAAKVSPERTKPVKVSSEDSSVDAAPQAKASKPVKAEKAPKAVQSDLFKGSFFHEVAVGTPAVRKNKAPQIATPAVRKPKGEESHDELIARIERELLNVRVNSKKVQKLQLCTKCCMNPVDTGFMVDRDTGYCEECAIVLGLGHTREARQQNFHPSLMKAEDQDSLE